METMKSWYFVSAINHLPRGSKKKKKKDLNGLFYLTKQNLRSV